MNIKLIGNLKIAVAPEVPDKICVCDNHTVNESDYTEDLRH